MGTPWGELPTLVAAHLQLSLSALGASLGVSVPVGILVSRRRRLEGPVLGVASVLQTIPSLALLAVMVPVLAGIGVFTQAWLGARPPSIGFLPAWVALTLYGMLPILRNTVTGLDGVEPALREAARGVGMTPGQSLWRVELPLALPVIVAGVRTASVWVVGTATLATPVGASSLGNLIFSGLQTRNTGSVLLGSAAAAVLALMLDALVRAVEVGLRRRHRGVLAAGLGGIVLLAVGVPLASGLAGRDGGRGDLPPVALGAKTFTEQYILMEAMAAQLEARTGHPVERVPSLGSTVAFDALVSGEIDAYVDYSGTIWATILDRADLPERRAAVLEEVRRILPERYGVHVLASLGFENTYALAMRRRQAESLSLATITDLAGVAGRLAIGGDFEFFSRLEWRSLERRYGLRFREQRTMDPALLYEAAGQGAVDVVSAFSTDGRIEAYDLVVLEDDRGVIPPYDAIVLGSARLVEGAPAAVEALAVLAGGIDAATMRRLNAQVDAQGRAPAEVARAWLESRGGAGLR